MEDYLAYLCYFYLFCTISVCLASKTNMAYITYFLSNPQFHANEKEEQSSISASQYS